MHLAQFNIARLSHGIDDPRVADFVNAADMVSGIAQRSPGFVWKLETEAGGVVEEVIDGDPMVVINLSVWEDLASLEHFVWNTLHKRFYLRRGEWFDAPEQPYLVMWRVDEGHRPSLAEAVARLEALRRNGPGPDAFDWDHARRGTATAMEAVFEGGADAAG